MRIVNDVLSEYGEVALQLKGYNNANDELVFTCESVSGGKSENMNYELRFSEPLFIHMPFSYDGFVRLERTIDHLDLTRFIPEIRLDISEFGNGEHAFKLFKLLSEEGETGFYVVANSATIEEIVV